MKKTKKRKPRQKKWYADILPHLVDLIKKSKSGGSLYVGHGIQETFPTPEGLRQYIGTGELTITLKLYGVQ